jgi:two-component system chemotaxis response regulator CheB
MGSTIKVLVVDDSALIRQMLTRALSLDPRIEVVGTARTGLEAIEKATDLQPDVITLDIQMPELDGLEALPHLIRTTDARVVMLSSVDDPDTTYQALALGAVDFISKPKTGFATSLTELSELLLKKIRTAYRVSPGHRLSGAEGAGQLEQMVRPAGAGIPADGRRAVADSDPADRVAIIASSTGGPPALEVVFSELTADLPTSYLVVQHLPAGFTASLVRRLQRVTDIEIAEAADGDRIVNGRALIAPHGAHMVVRGRKLPRIAIETGPSMHGVCPAADPTLASAAHVFGEQAIGVVLTGMGSDGAAGLRDVFEAGGRTIVQDEGSSVVWGMPRAAARIGAASRIVPLDGIATEIRRAVRDRGAG